MPRAGRPQKSVRAKQTGYRGLPLRSQDAEWMRKAALQGQVRCHRTFFCLKQAEKPDDAAFPGVAEKKTLRQTARAKLEQRRVFHRTLLPKAGCGERRGCSNKGACVRERVTCFTCYGTKERRCASICDAITHDVRIRRASPKRFPFTRRRIPDQASPLRSEIFPLRARNLSRQS